MLLYLNIIENRSDMFRRCVMWYPGQADIIQVADSNQNPCTFS